MSKPALDNLVIPPSDIEIKAWPEQSRRGMQTGVISAGILISHKPTGVMVSCEEHRSQHKNRATALSKLKNILIKMNTEDAPMKLIDIMNEVKLGSLSPDDAKRKTIEIMEGIVEGASVGIGSVDATEMYGGIYEGLEEA